ncbi:DNA-binding transcriptional LysR family regulator [Rhodopseudomonas rhenobacensis]|uniref:DNA-binding transcriptional LysR family regulator n=1 Tax=Rhodopseudomonas rhenobacensis TaxID=87461 RepID=A0A7W7Z5V3_9BRAD|nr:LysR family transcriptional regulator [Rhodopseudomonas rhenobacensis]MBB5048577.1 DNA-binding transcriptional LysR family regulator [Rhodopseudomonas rhenobacensis]
MTLDQLRIFIAVAEHQHMTRAASELNLTQSATSSAIAALEQRYAIKLFDRIGRGIVLTQTGRAFLGEARAVVGRANAAAQVLNDLAGLKRGTLTLAASQTVANYWLPQRLQAFRKRHPGIDVRLAIANTEQVAAAVHDGRADLGFVEGPVDDPLLAARRIDGDSLVIVVGAQHPWAGQRRITARRLPLSGWVLRERGSGTRAMFEAAMRKAGVKPSELRVELELPSNEAVRAAVEAGDCATALSDLVAAPSLAAGTLHRIDFALPRRAFFVLRHKQHAATRTETALLESFLP